MYKLPFVFSFLLIIIYYFFTGLLGQLNMYISEYVKNSLRLKKENGAVKDKAIRDVRTFFEQEKEDQDKPLRIGNAFSNNYIEC